MACCGKGIVRVGLITAIAGGTLVAIAGPERVFALATQARQNVSGAIDHLVDDPIAMRAQLKSLEAQYPKKIAEVRADLNEVRAQISQLDRETKVSSKVVELTRHDLERLDGVITEARGVQHAHPGAVVRVSFNASSMDLEDAYAQRTHIERTRNMHLSRVSDLEQDLGYLAQQESQLSELLVKLETERESFQSQLFQLDSQIDSIARNERMIEMMEDRQRTIESHSKFEANSLDQITHRLKTKRNEQRAQLEAIASRESRQSYEDIASFMVDVDGVHTAPTSEPAGGFIVEPVIIDVPEQGGTEPMAARD